MLAGSKLNAVILLPSCRYNKQLRLLQLRRQKLELSIEDLKLVSLRNQKRFAGLCLETARQMIKDKLQ